MITEQEMYDYCSLYLDTKRSEPSKEGEQRTFILISVYETESDMGSMASIVDPAYPPKRTTPQNFEKMTWGQQVASAAGPKIAGILHEVSQEVIRMHNLARQLDIPLLELMEIFAQVDTAEEFQQKLKERVRG